MSDDNCYHCNCHHCGNWHSGACPRIKSIEYFPNGTVKRVEYHGSDGQLEKHRWPWAGDKENATHAE